MMCPCPLAAEGLCLLYFSIHLLLLLHPLLLLRLQVWCDPSEPGVDQEGCVCNSAGSYKANAWRGETRCTAVAAPG
jgi:hypothetical protein